MLSDVGDASGTQSWLSKTQSPALKELNIRQTSLRPNGRNKQVASAH